MCPHLRDTSPPSPSPSRQMMHGASLPPTSLPVRWKTLRKLLRCSSCAPPCPRASPAAEVAAAVLAVGAGALPSAADPSAEAKLTRFVNMSCSRPVSPEARARGRASSMAARASTSAAASL
eukprot:CAMPEP_0174739416 /NCGR_PEP_ID=MMETSP1094-20130205/71588_1 /TAXON_ID=156173 /ORGANISM="Chrysochromulina brevifilum, Strain UTEX LB 985" /LENGTH=120 /DNA_ID=CAMNT_0015942979 /DNA_START=90 /DNA_END=452 /DNA_ORIENTATION=-